VPDLTREDVLARLTSFRQYLHDGERVPHKPLLVLLALGRLDSSGSSVTPWSVAETKLADLIAEFGPASRTGRAQSAAYPFTRLRNDKVWVLDRDVPNDGVGLLREHGVTGHLDQGLEARLREDPRLLHHAARRLVEAQFPPTVAADVLVAVGLDPDVVLGAEDDVTDLVERRRRSARWREQVLAAWDRQCAFCGFDGQLGGAIVGIEAAHVRWFNLDGPDAADNGLALCSLHHKLFDRGALGLTSSHSIQVSRHFSARTDEARRVYELHDRPLRPRPGTPLPAPQYVSWHDRQVFKGDPIAS